MTGEQAVDALTTLGLAGIPARLVETRVLRGQRALFRVRHQHHVAAPGVARAQFVRIDRAFSQVVGQRPLRHWDSSGKGSGEQRLPRAVGPDDGPVLAGIDVPIGSEKQQPLAGPHGCFTKRNQGRRA
jgi:hypothetical protein